MNDIQNKGNLILIGFMGSGKTSVGIKLSYIRKRSMEDTDKLIEQKAGKSISQIFADQGEAAFREMETKLLEELAHTLHNRILSVGGGTPLREENRKLLKQIGTVVYLRIRPETVYERLKGDTTRPLLQCGNPLARIRELLEKRSGIYEEAADLIVDVDGLEVEEVADRILEGQQKLWGRRLQAGQESGGRKGMKILVINGPNLNFLGIREKSVYGTQDYRYLLDMIANKGKEDGHDITVFQSNHEGAIIDRIQEAYFDGTEGVVINPGAYTHYSYAIRDALASITVPKVEIHISDITQREDFRKVSVTAPVCDRQIYGKGLEGYLMAIDFVAGFSGK